MSIGPGAADAVLQPARAQARDSHSGEQGERRVEASTEIPEARPAGTGVVTSFGIPAYSVQVVALNRWCARVSDAPQRYG